jgi:AraC family transcriptional regulator
MTAREGSYGSRLGAAFGVTDPPTVSTRTFQRGTIAVTDVHLDTCSEVMTEHVPIEDAYLLTLMTRNHANYELWMGNQSIPTCPAGIGDMAIYNLNLDPVCLMREGVSALHLYLSRSALDAIADDAGAAHIVELDDKLSRPVSDPIFRQLVSTLMPSLAHTEAVNGLFVDHVLQAIGVHVAQTYGGMKLFSHRARGGLAPWQERNAKELMEARIDTDLSLTQLASECRLSVSQFARAFRQSTGVAPHRWLMERRVDKAKHSLLDATLPLTDVAIACGFADQSHFTRVFKNAVGVSPGSWRRMRIR